MSRLKGCVNECCVSQQKKRKYKEKDSFCLNCGGRLLCLCKKCRAVLIDDYDGTLCNECKMKAREKNAKLLKFAGKSLVACGSVAVVFTTAFPKLRQISGIISRVKKKKQAKRHMA